MSLKDTKCHHGQLDSNNTTQCDHQASALPVKCCPTVQLLIGSLFLVYLCFSRKWQLVSTSPRPPGGRPKSGNISWSTKNRFRLSIWTKSGPKSSAADNFRFGACGAEFSCLVQCSFCFLFFVRLCLCACPCPCPSVSVGVRVSAPVSASVCLPRVEHASKSSFSASRELHSSELSGCSGPEAWSRRCLQGWSPGASSP